MSAEVICVLGPTASGKSSLAQSLAERLDGEVISADSMQIYKGMDIGTAKIPADERSCPYFCLDILEPGQPYSAALFQRDARAAIDGIAGRGKQPILTGGTGLYVKAALDDMDFAAGEQEGNEVRRRYELFLEEEGADALWRLLDERDHASAQLIHPNNIRRVVRALEMAERGESYAERKLRFKSVPPRYPSIKIGLRLEREELYRRIDARVDAMVDAGLADEVSRLLEAGFAEGLTAPQAIGYKEIVDAFEGHCSFDDAVRQIKQSTRRYAKRQLTWLKSDADIKWVDADRLSAEALLAQAMEIIGQARLS